MIQPIQLLFLITVSLIFTSCAGNSIRDLERKRMVKIELSNEKDYTHSVEMCAVTRSDVSSFDKSARDGFVRKLFGNQCTKLVFVDEVATEKEGKSCWRQKIVCE
ncbi:hypothetical protein ACLVWU_08590 [Bdellovibrio sp. HCB290]|uniref:hypothetical protein n=1 Tax=Bdellovibrio sp. HCB290 TaxID=3394356 RepID=UPI0039B464EA